MHYFSRLFSKKQPKTNQRAKEQHISLLRPLNYIHFFIFMQNEVFHLHEPLSHLTQGYIPYVIPCSDHRAPMGSPGTAFSVRSSRTPRI